MLTNYRMMYDKNTIQMRAARKQQDLALQPIEEDLHPDEGGGASGGRVEEEERAGCDGASGGTAVEEAGAVGLEDNLLAGQIEEGSRLRRRKPVNYIKFF